MHNKNGDVMELFILCIKIFFIRIIDVSLGTFRTMATVKGKSVTAALIGFFEVLVWFLIVKEALNTTNNSIFIAISYSLGFATGTYIGSVLSNKYIKGNLSVQIITKKAYPNMVDGLRNKGFAVSLFEVIGKNKDENKYMLFIEISNSDYFKLQKLVKKYDESAFIVANESKYVQNGYFMNQIVK